MELVWAAGGAAAGLPAAAALRGSVFRLSVASGAPERTACPHCAVPVRRFLPLQCAACGLDLGPPVVLEVATSLVLALVFGRFGGHPEAVVFGFLGTLGVALAAIDIAVQRLPDRLTLPAYPVMIILLAVSAVIEHDAGALVRAVLGGLAITGAYLVLALARPGQLGGGDIKLAGLAGLALGWLGWPALLAGAAFGFLLLGLVSLALLAARRVRLDGAVCFGPFLLGGALLAILAIGH